MLRKLFWRGVDTTPEGVLNRQEFEDAQRTHWLWSGVRVPRTSEPGPVHRPTAADVKSVATNSTVLLLLGLGGAGWAGYNSSGNVWAYPEAYFVGLLTYSLGMTLLLTARRWAARKDLEVRTSDNDLAPPVWDAKSADGQEESSA